MVCKDHPLAKVAKKGVLIRSWSYDMNEKKKMYFTESVYFPRYAGHKFVPVNNQLSTNYENLDLFSTKSRNKATDGFCNIFFQRKAKVYLLVHGHVRGDPKAYLRGWKSEGWAMLSKEYSSNRRLVFGLGKRRGNMTIPHRAYVFSKVASKVQIPSHKALGAKIRGIKLAGYWSLLVAEADGSKTKAPRNPPGINIPAGGRCPEALHDKWVTRGTDPSDPQTFDKEFKTFHPLWDPCYWCAYDHEHGSDAKSLMGYAPKYGYTAMKNGLQKEAHKGFKDFVLEVKGKYLYYGLHAQMSKGRRFGARHHTLVMAVTDKRSKGKLQLELNFKADYGHRAVRLRKKGQSPLTSDDEKLDEQINGRGPRRRRLINVYDPENINRRFRYRRSPFERRGEYEQWATVPMCSKARRGFEPTVDFKDMGLALRSLNSTPSDVVNLGRTRDGVFIQNPSTNREFKAKSFLLAESECYFYSPATGLKPDKSGKFYTDVYGNEAVKGPAHNACAQFMRPGFRLEVSGRFETIDTWYGLYQEGKKGHMRNVGYAISESEN